MTVEISARDLNGKPIRVHEANGFVEISRPYDAKTDGWIDDQLALKVCYAWVLKSKPSKSSKPWVTL